MGRLRPGHTANAVGRPTGRPNDTTIAAGEAMRAHSKEAADIVIARMHDSNPWVSLAAARMVAERTLPKDGDGAPVDTSFIRYLTPRQITLIDRWITKAKARAYEELGDNPDGVIAEGSTDHLDVSNRAAWEELHTIDVTPKRDAFSLGNLPAPQATPATAPDAAPVAAPAPPPEDDFEEF